MAVPTVAKSKPKTFHFPEVRVVEASAGSGKTYALAKRYIQLLFNPELHLEDIPIRNILAITFTNKAAFEMKARILEFLKAIALGQFSKQQEDDLLRPIGITQEEAKYKAFAIMENLIHHYNFFQVQTIDKFINALLSGCAFKIGLTANFKIKTNSSEYLEYSLDELIDQATHNKGLSKMFEHFLHNYLYLENRTGWFPKQDMLAIVCTLFAQYNAYGYEFKTGMFVPEDLIKNKKNILKKIKDLRKSLPEETDKRFLNSLDRFLKQHTKGFDIDRVSDYFAREDVPVRKNTNVSRELEKQWNDIREDLKLLCEEEAYSLFNPYIQIYNHVQDGFRALAAKDDVLFLEELNKRAGYLFDEDYITVEELYYRLATRFHHYLIDEFQDTSRLQWQNVEKMTEEALSTGGSLFYVGDRKQAIYGFRGGEVELFDDIKHQFQAFNVQIEQLSKNWRSQRAIVDFNNAVFSLDNLRSFIRRKESYESEKNKKGAVVFGEEDYNDIDHVFKNAQQNFQPQNNQGYVKVEYINIDKKEERDELIRERLIDLIKDLKRRFSYRDIAILARSNFEVEQMTNWLLEENILVESERTSNIQENPLIKEMMALLKFLDSPIDNIVFTNFILGDVFSKATGLKTKDMHAFVFDLRDRLYQEKDLYIYMEFRKKYPEVWNKFFDEFFKNVGLYPLYEFVVSIYSKFDCLKNFSSYQGFFMHLLELIKTKEEEFSDLTSFIDYFERIQGEESYVHVTDSEAIKILTIHKSKGLEFPVVILPFLGMDIQVGSTSSDYQQSYILRKHDRQMELLRLKKKYFGFSEHLWQIHSVEYKKAFLSELNNIYVALTRPQNELYCFIPKRVGNSFNFVSLLVPEENYEMGEQVQYRRSHKDKQASSILTLPCSKHHDWIDFLKDEFLDFNQIVNREKRLEGEVLHFMLSFIENLKKGEEDKMIKKAVKEAKFEFMLIDDFTYYEKKLSRLLRKKALHDVFFTDDQVLNEKEVVNPLGHTRRIDRLIIKKSDVWIIDYKSSDDAQAIQEEQVKEYQEIISTMYPDKQVKGFLLYLDSITLKQI